MSSITSYKTTAFKESQKFLVIDPSTQSPSLVLGSELVSYITPMLNYVRADSTRLSAENTDYDVGTLVQTSGATSPGDNLASTYLVVEGGTGDFPMLNGNDLLVVAGDDDLRAQLISSASGEGSDLVTHTGTSDTVTEALDKRTIFVGSVAELEALTPSSGDVAYLSKSGRSGEFVFLATDQSVKVASDPKKGVFVAPLSDPTGASGAWMRCYDGLTNNGGVDPRWFVEDGDSDDTAAFQAAVDYAESEVNGSVAIRVQGRLQISSTINIGSISLTIRGVNWNRDIIFYSGSGYCLESSGGENRLENIRFLANPGTPKTNNAVNFGGNLTMNSVWFGGFVNGVEWNGGFYHKYYNCKFIDVDYPLWDFNGNNVLVSGTQFSSCIDVATVVAGTGNFTFQGSSFEDVSGDCFSQSAGSNCSYSISDSYFEGCDEVLVASRGSHVFKDNNIQIASMVTGVRLSGSDSANPVSIDASGNKWIGSTDGNNDADFIYQLSGERDSLQIDDFWVPLLSPYGGAFLTEFVSGESGFNSVSGRDAITGLGLTKSYTTLTMLNSWTTQGAGSGVDVFAYKEHNGVLYVRGRIDGAASTSTTVATLPSEIYERIATENTYWFNAASRTAGSITGFVRSDNGNIVIEQQVNDIIVNFSMSLL